MTVSSRDIVTKRRRLGPVPVDIRMSISLRKDKNEYYMDNQIILSSVYAVTNIKDQPEDRELIFGFFINPLICDGWDRQLHCRSQDVSACVLIAI